MSEPLYSFPPLVAPRARVLILGTMPGKESLRKQQYYGHPQNSFWRILFDLFGESFSIDYEQRCELIRKYHLALWDVLQSCHRDGSLDAAIRTEIPNDIPNLLKQQLYIKTIVFNGRPAARYYEHFFGQTGNPAYRILPSTSPAYAAMDYSAKLSAWSIIRQLVIDPI